MLKVLLAMKDPPQELDPILANHSVEKIPEGASAQSYLRKSNYDVAIIEGGLEEIGAVKEIDPRVEVILVGPDEECALEAVRFGATAYFTRPVDAMALARAIGDIDELARLRAETHELEKSLIDKYRFCGIVGRNPRMIEIFNFIRRIAPYYRSITITGETGTGKELVARAIHSTSPVSAEPFVTFNCGGVVDTMIESELFGHKKGAFTGAIRDKAGLFEAAGGGTLFLDEISSMPLSVQPHLLRVLQDGEFRRLGSTSVLKARCRVIAASNRDLAEEVKKGNFRDDLFFRLTPLSITIPPLRERKDDLPLLFRHFLNAFNNRTGKGVRGVSRQAQSALIAYTWPGNVRELENVIEQAAIVTTESFIRLEDLPSNVRSLAGRRPFTPGALDEVIKNHIEKTLKECGNNRTRAAEILGISRRSLIRKIEKYAIH